MLERFLEQQTTILATLMSKNLQRGTEVHTLSEADISNAEDIVKSDGTHKDHYYYDV